MQGSRIVAAASDSSTATGISSYTESTECDAPRVAQGGYKPYGYLAAARRSAGDLGGVILMGVRLYNPTTGRFLSTDPTYGGNDNPYTYPDNPVDGSDLDGQCGTFENPKKCKGFQASDVLLMIRGKLAVPSDFFVDAATRNAFCEWRPSGLGETTLQRVNGDGCSVPKIKKKQWDRDYAPACGAHDAAYEINDYLHRKGFHVFGKQKIDDWFGGQVFGLCERAGKPEYYCAGEGTAAVLATRTFGGPW